MASDRLRSAQDLLDLTFQSLAMQHMDLKQVELDTAVAKVDELSRQLESLWTDGPGPPKEPYSPSRTRSPLGRRSLAPESAELSGDPLGRPGSPRAPHYLPGEDRAPSPRPKVLAVPYEGLTLPSPGGRAPSPRPHRPYEFLGLGGSPRPGEGSVFFPERAPSPRPPAPPPYEVHGLYPSITSPAVTFRAQDDLVIKRRPQKSWNESDLDVAYEKKPPGSGGYDRTGEGQPGLRPVLAPWRESSLDGASGQGKDGAYGGAQCHPPPKLQGVPVGRRAAGRGTLPAFGGARDPAPRVAFLPAACLPHPCAPAGWATPPPQTLAPLHDLQAAKCFLGARGRCSPGASPGPPCRSPCTPKAASAPGAAPGPPGAAWRPSRRRGSQSWSGCCRVVSPRGWSGRSAPRGSSRSCPPKPSGSPNSRRWPACWPRCRDPSNAVAPWSRALGRCCRPTRTRQYQQLITRLLHRPPRRDEPPAPGDAGTLPDLPPPTPVAPEARPPRHSPPPQSPSSSAPALELRSALRDPSSPRRRPGARVRLNPLVLLLDAALTGELDVVQQAVAELNDPSQPNDEGITALHNAICGANYGIVDFLIASGANVNSPDSHGWTPLHCAASCNDTGVCVALVRHGAAIFATTTSDGSLAVEKCDPYREGYADCYSYLTEVEQSMGVLNSGVVYALWDYSAEFGDELSFREGEPVTVLRRQPQEELDWWWGSLYGHEGYVPRNYFGLFPRVRPQRKKV
ncbi:unnamed protein product [Bubo scandiacus]